MCIYLCYLRCFCLQVYETREITGDLLRRYSEAQFSLREMKLPQEAQIQEKKQEATA